MINAFKRLRKPGIMYVKYGLLLLRIEAYKHKKINLEQLKNTRRYIYKNTVVCYHVLALIIHFK